MVWSQIVGHLCLNVVLFSEINALWSAAQITLTGVSKSYHSLGIIVLKSSASVTEL